jgi:hypothetical protein
MDHHAHRKSAAPAAQVAEKSALDCRADELRRAYQRRLNHRPTVLQRTIIGNASILTARAEIASADPTCSINDYVRACRVASEAREAVEAMLAQSEPEEYLPTLDEMLGAG